MSMIFSARGLTRRFDGTTALDRVDLDLVPHTVTGLIGRNGCGKTTLIRTMVGLLLPTTGDARTFGTPTADLGERELGRIGAVFQENRLLGWMTVREHLDFAAAYHPEWDDRRMATLLAELELDPGARVAKLSPGNAQKLALLLAVCPRPELLLLDEPVSALDPIAREGLLRFLLELVREDDATIVVSSHTLVDIERVVDRVLCLDRGRVVHDGALDELLEGYAEWRVTAAGGQLPDRFREDWVVDQKLHGRQAMLLVRTGVAGPDGPGALEGPAARRRREFEERHGVAVEARPANLDRIFPALVGWTPTPAEATR